MNIKYCKIGSILQIGKIFDEIESKDDSIQNRRVGNIIECLKFILV